MSRTRYNQDDQSVLRARALRRQATPAERKLWSLLRGGALDGFKFRRQQRLGPFFGDFVCQSARLVIEVDGITHEGPEAEWSDVRRTAYLEHEGYRVVRFSNAQVMSESDGVVASIRVVLGAVAPSPSHAAEPRGPLPLPQGERR